MPNKRILNDDRSLRGIKKFKMSNAKKIKIEDSNKTDVIVIKEDEQLSLESSYGFISRNGFIKEEQSEEPEECNDEIFEDDEEEEQEIEIGPLVLTDEKDPLSLDNEPQVTKNDHNIDSYLLNKSKNLECVNTDYNKQNPQTTFLNNAGKLPLGNQNCQIAPNSINQRLETVSQSVAPPKNDNVMRIQTSAGLVLVRPLGTPQYKFQQSQTLNVQKPPIQIVGNTQINYVPLNRVQLIRGAPIQQNKQKNRFILPYSNIIHNNRFASSNIGNNANHFVNLSTNQVLQSSILAPKVQISAPVPLNMGTMIPPLVPIRAKRNSLQLTNSFPIIQPASINNNTSVTTIVGIPTQRSNLVANTENQKMTTINISLSPFRSRCDFPTSKALDVPPKNEKCCVLETMENFNVLSASLSKEDRVQLLLEGKPHRINTISQMNDWVISCPIIGQVICWYCFLFAEDFEISKVTNTKQHELSAVHLNSKEGFLKLNNILWKGFIHDKYQSSGHHRGRLSNQIPTRSDSKSIEPFLQPPFVKFIDYNEKNQIIRKGRPCPLLNLSCFNKQVYEEVKWLTGSDKLNRFFCWPCLLYSNKFGFWSQIGFSNVANLTVAIQLHDSTTGHRKAASDFNIVFGNIKRK